MIPDDAKIFEYINDDDACGVQNLVEQGLASLSDCDSLGRPLLYVRTPLDKDYVWGALTVYSMRIMGVNLRSASIWLVIKQMSIFFVLVMREDSPKHY
jgi:hypothetical protein